MGSVFLTRLSKTLGKRTVQHIKFIMSSIFNHAVATGHCETNPIRDTKVLGKQREPGAMKSYTLEEIENAISALVDSLEAQLVMALAFFLGLRKGELQGLQWGDIDGGYVHIRRNVTRGVVTTPKTKKSVRSVPMIQPVHGLLLLWRKKNPNGVWIFQNERGTSNDFRMLTDRTIKPALKKAGIKWKGLQACRRGLGTTLRVLTGNSNAGRDVLGHTTTQTTEEHYEDRMPEEALKGMRLLEAKALNGDK
jgi:integrase